MQSILDLLNGVNLTDLILRLENMTDVNGSPLAGHLIMVIINQATGDRIASSELRQGWAGPLWMTIPNPFTSSFSDAPSFVYANASDHFREAVWAAEWVAARLGIEIIETPLTQNALFERLSIETDLELVKAGANAARSGLCPVPPASMPYAYFRGYKATIGS